MQVQSMLCIHHLCVLDKWTLICRQHMLPGFLHIYPQETYLEMTIYCLISAVIPPTEDCDLIITSVTDLLVSPNAAIKPSHIISSLMLKLTYVSEKIHVLLFSILGFLALFLFFRYIYQVSNTKSVSLYSVLLKYLPTLSNQKALFIF